MDTTTELTSRYRAYLKELAEAIAHQDRVESLIAYISGLTLPAERKSVEPIAARIEPGRVSARHQSLLHFVGQSPWDDRAVLAVARDYALAQLLNHSPISHWIIDDTGFPKKGKHSIGVANLYCGILGKNANSQVTDSLSVANSVGFLPVAFQLYLPEKWANAMSRRAAAGVPEDIVFAPKWKIAIALIEQAIKDGLTLAPVLADAGFGDATDFRQRLTELGLVYTVGLSHTTTVWPEGMQPLPPEIRSRRGKPSLCPRPPNHPPVAHVNVPPSGHELWHP